MELGPFEQVLAVIVIVDQLLETLNECQSIRDCGRCLDNIGERHVLKECGEFEQLLLRQFDDVLENCAQFSRVTFHCLSQKLKIKALGRSEEHTSELQSLMRNSYAVFCLKKKKKQL